MKTYKYCSTILAVLALLVFVTMSALAVAETSVERGKALFNDPNFAGASRSCSSCHVEGRGMEGVAKKESFTVMGSGMASLEDVVNFCIEKAAGGKPIAKDSQEMKDIIEYIKSLTPVNIGVRG